MFSGYYAPSGILGPNHCRLRRTGNIRYPRTWELHQQLGTFAMVHNLKKALTPHTWFYIVRYKSPSVGKIGEHLAIKSIRTKVGVGLVLSKKRRNKKSEKVYIYVCIYIYICVCVKKGRGGKEKKKWKRRWKKRSEWGRKREWARKIYTSQRLPCVHTFKLWHNTSAENNSTAWLLPTLLSRLLAKPCHNPHPLPALHSMLKQLQLTCKRNAPLLVRGFATPLHLASARTHERRRTLRLQSSC